MKYIFKPENGQFTIEQFISWVVNTDKRYNETGAGIRLGMRIEDAVTKSEGKPYIELQPDHCASLADAAENPSAGYPPIFAVTPDGKQERIPGQARVWLRCVDAIRDAKDEPPATEEPEAKAAE